MKKQLKKIFGEALGILGLLLVFAVADQFGLMLASKAAAIPCLWGASKILEK